MKRAGQFATRTTGVVAALGIAAGTACALPLTFGVSGAAPVPASAPAESVTFDVSGTKVIVSLREPRTTGEPAKSGALTAVFSSANANLPGVGNAEPAYDGNHEGATCEAIFGWAWNPQQPDAPIAVGIYADDTLLTTVTADQFRADLRDAHMGAGRHAFTSRLPPELKDGMPHQIRVVVAGSDYDLANTPKEITCAPVPGPK